MCYIYMFYTAAVRLSVGVKCDSIGLFPTLAEISFINIRVNIS